MNDHNRWVDTDPAQLDSRDANRHLAPRTLCPSCARRVDPGQVATVPAWVVRSANRAVREKDRRIEQRVADGRPVSLEREERDAVLWLLRALGVQP